MNSFRGKVLPTADIGIDKGEIWCMLYITLSDNKDVYAYVSCTGVEGLDMKDLAIEFMDAGWASLPYEYNRDMFEEIENVSWNLLTELLDEKPVSEVV